jgi:hypothetical protein
MAKLKQANPTKFYVAKYLFLIFGLLQLTVAAVLAYQFGNTPKNASASFIFICMGSVLIVLFFYVRACLRRVAIGKDRLVVIEAGKNIRIEWQDVKSIKLIPIFNLYKLSLKARKTPLYFFPSKNIEPAYDLLAADTSKMGEIVSKRKKKLGI